MKNNCFVKYLSALNETGVDEDCNLTQKVIHYCFKSNSCLNTIPSAIINLAWALSSQQLLIRTKTILGD